VESRSDSAESSSRTRGAQNREIPVPAPYSPDESWAARRADALALMAETLLAHGPSESSACDRHQVVVHVDAAVLADPARDGRAHIENGPAVAVETVRRLTCDGALVTMTDDAGGNPLDVGRKTRAIPPSLRRALKSRDGGRRFPGCSHRRFADGHHIRHWGDGGETKLDNLVMLCRIHHRLVHEDGFTVGRNAAGALVFRAPDGRIVEEKPTYAVLAADPVLRLFESHRDLGITARTCVPEWFGERADYNWITDALWRRDERARTASQPNSHSAVTDQRLDPI
jgi:hypothetical protein